MAEAAARLLNRRSPLMTKIKTGLDPRLVRYIERVRAIATAPLSDVAKLRRVREAATELVAERVVIGAEFRHVPARGYGRNLLYRDAQTDFVVIAMIWPPHSGGRPHDHGTWGVVAVAEGEVEVTNYEREDGGSNPAFAVLRPLGSVRAAPGATATVLPPHEDFHSVRNALTDRTSVTIHTYGREPRNYHGVDLATGAVAIGELVYDNE